jgi:hypothetical protein
MTWWVTLMTAEPPQSDAESTKPDANSRRSNNQIATVVVPIVVAVIGLIGVIIASIIASQDNGNGADGGQTTEDPQPHSIQVVGWVSRNVEPPPRVELQFRGQSVGLKTGEQIFILAEFADQPEAEAPVEPPAEALINPLKNYDTSPPAILKDDGTWIVTWVLEGPPAYASYTAVIASLPAGGSPDVTAPPPPGPPPPLPTTQSPTPTTIPTPPTPSGEVSPPPVEKLRRELAETGPRSSVVTAQDTVDMPPE